jgi:hypothetical protein
MPRWRLGSGAQELNDSKELWLFNNAKWMVARNDHME